jgi:hypothetical protein
VNASNFTTRVYGGTEDPRSAMLGGHSTLNTVVLGEGISKYQIPPHFGHHISAPIPGDPDDLCFRTGGNIVYPGGQGPRMDGKSIAEVPGHEGPPL